MTVRTVETGRAVEEWRGSSPDAKIPDRVKLRIWTRCKGVCGLTGRKIRPGEAYDFDHILPLGLGGAHTESNLHVVLRDAHKAKTADDRARMAKADRIARKNAGLWPKSRARLSSRPFPKTRPTP